MQIELFEVRNNKQVRVAVLDAKEVNALMDDCKIGVMLRLQQSLGRTFECSGEEENPPWAS